MALVSKMESDLKVLYNVLEKLEKIMEIYDRVVMYIQDLKGRGESHFFENVQMQYKEEFRDCKSRLRVFESRVDILKEYFVAWVKETKNVNFDEEFEKIVYNYSNLTCTLEMHKIFIRRSYNKILDKFVEFAMYEIGHETNNSLKSLWMELLQKSKTSQR